MTTDQPTGIEIAHVADVLEAHFGATDYDVTAEYAASLLTRYPDLLAMASQYANNDATEWWLRDAVRIAVETDNQEGGI